MTKTQEQLRQEGLRAARNMVRKFKAREKARKNQTVSLNPNNVKVVGFENLIGDGPSGFDYWQDTKWCC